MSEELKALAVTAAFLLCYFLPLDIMPFGGPAFEALALVRSYAREHVLLCLVPAFFIAGAISSFVSKASVMRYFGAGASKLLSYGVAAVSGTMLAVCSCTVLPLFAGIYRRGAGLGPAIAFLYSGPAINVLAIILTARVLGFKLGVARAVGAIAFSVVIGLLMHLIFLKRERERQRGGEFQAGFDLGEKPLWKTSLFFASMVGFMVFANWGAPENGAEGIWAAIYGVRWYLSVAMLVALAIMLWRWFIKAEIKFWALSSWNFAWQILPLLLVGVLVAGLLMGRPGEEGLIPSNFISSLVGGNSIGANLVASVAGAFMYFATLTEIPILQGLIGNGMGQGPALALLLAGPALSLPNMLVIRKVIGLRMTLVYVALVVIMATVSGLIYGYLSGISILI